MSAQVSHVLSFSGSYVLYIATTRLRRERARPGLTFGGGLLCCAAVSLTDTASSWRPCPSCLEEALLGLADQLSEATQSAAMSSEYSLFPTRIQSVDDIAISFHLILNVLPPSSHSGFSNIIQNDVGTTRM
eukprot:gene5594-biopygen13245